MTRETKVGLLVGLAIILVVGIVVSDHLSKVSQQSPAENLTGLALETQRSLSTTGTPYGSDSSASRPSTPATGMTPGMIPGSSSVTGSMPAAPNRVESIPLPVEMADATPAGAHDRVDNRGAAISPDRPITLDRAADAALATDGRGPEEILTHPLLVPVDTLPTPPLASRVDSGMPVERAPIAPIASAPTTPATPAPTPAIVSANLQPIYHVVQQGETLYSLAKKYYNNGEYWRSIQEANSQIVGPKGNVALGQKLTIPNKSGLISAASATPASATASTPASSSSTSGTRYIVVEPGQTLSIIAEEHLGASKRWDEILAANRDTLKSPDQLKVGMKLRLPEKATGGFLDHAATTGGPTPSAKPATAKPVNTYTIRTGDTLVTISRVTLGDGKHWRRIYELNRDQLSDPDSIEVGMTLKVPSRP
ncbi:MAG: LysM peptidoglycan-binding domain-containing protein [Phycisphaeraceae bacterium]|nr:LysM peptidoglycan-binding domain-containing protein [Phycisphaeraceae bacterium]